MSIFYNSLALAWSDDAGASPVVLPHQLSTAYNQITNALQ